MEEEEDDKAESGIRKTTQPSTGMGRNARRTHNLKNKQGARWGCAEGMRRRKRGKSLPGFSVRLHGFARVAGKKVWAAWRGKGHISRAEGASEWVGVGVGGELGRREGGCAAP